MKIRKATPEDHLKAAELIYQANLDLASLVMGEDTKEKTIEGLAKFFVLKGNFLSYENCTIVEIDGNTVGCMITLPHDKSETLSYPIIDNLMNKYKPGSEGYKKYIEPQLEVSESFEGEYYIDSLAVEKKYRGYGLGKNLMIYAENLALDNCCNKTSLLCSYSNDKAYRLYKSLGYNHDIDIKIKDLKYKHMVKSL